MLKRFFCFALSLSLSQSLFAQKVKLKVQLDSLLNIERSKPFNGVVLVVKGEHIEYEKVTGFSDLDRKTALTGDDQFVIGSISKQFTAVMVLQELDKGHLKLSDPIHKYLPELKQSWADSVTIHQLLTHTNGIMDLTGPLAFTPGTRFDYSQLGYDLLSKIIEKTSGKSFAVLSAELFGKCNMIHTYHPEMLGRSRLVKGYTEQSNGALVYESASLDNYPAAGSFISTAHDLLLWNRCLHGGELLKSSTYSMMITKQKNAVRMHPIFGATNYGYGITIDDMNHKRQLGQTGFAPGFVSMDYYYPKSKTSIIVLQNEARDTDDLNKTFYYPVEVLKIINGF